MNSDPGLLFFLFWADHLHPDVTVFGAKLKLGKEQPEYSSFIGSSVSA